MTDHPQMTIDGREAPVQAPPVVVSHEAPRLFDHAPSIRGQMTMSAREALILPALLASDPADWPVCSFCQDAAAEVLRTVEDGEGFPPVVLDACRACETNPDWWDEPGAEIITTREDQ